MRYAITGATGFIGSRLVECLAAEPDARVTVFTRDPGSARERIAARPGCELVAWDYAASLPPAGALDGVDAIIHLAGEPVAGRRWSAAQKKRIRDSRVLSTRNLIAGLERAAPRPRILAAASAIGYYGPRNDEDLDEGAPAGTDFLAEVCRDWEAEVARAELHGIREARVRIGIVLGPGGGALKPLVPAFKMFAGGPLGNGRQWMSWIHRDDLVQLFLHAVRTPSVRGSVNGTSPHPVRNREFAKALGRVLHRPALLPTPRFVLRVALGEFADILATGQRVLPRKALESGFRFRYPDLAEALREILGAAAAPARASA